MNKSKENNKKEGRTRKKAIPETKIKTVEELTKLIEKYDTIAISSACGVPSSRLQLIRKSLRDKAEMRVVKKNLFSRAAEKAKKCQQLVPYLEKGQVVLFTQLDPFELAALLSENRVKIKARQGQIALQDIVIEEGITDIPAGPMISEMSSAGLKVAVEQGKIAIKKEAILVHKNEKISEIAASILSKLEMLPFEVGLDIIAAFSSKENKLFENIIIDKKATFMAIKSAIAMAKALATKIEYFCVETMPVLLAKAAAHEAALEAALKNQNKNQEQNNQII